MNNPSIDKRITKSFTLQQDKTDCGVACLLSLVKYYGGEGELDYYRELSGTNREGTTLKGLSHAANHVGLQSEGYMADLTALIAHGQPTILHVLIDNHLSHYVICFEYINGHFIVGDPSKGIKEMTEEELDKIWVSKSCLVVNVGSDFKLKEDINRSKKQWIKSLIREDFKILLASTLLGIGMTVLGLSMAFYQEKLVDKIIPENNKEGLLVSTVAIIFILLLKSLLSAVRSTLLIEQSKGFNIRIVGSFLQKLLHLPKPFFDTRKTGDFIARLNDTSRIQRVISLLVGNTIIDIIISVVTVIFLFFLSWVIGVFTLIGLSFYFIVIVINNDKIISSQKSVMGNYAANESQYIDTINGITDIKSYGMYDHFLDKNIGVFRNYQSSLFKLGKLNIKLTVTANVISTLIIVIVLAIGSSQVMADQLKLGSLIAIMGVTMSLIPSVSRLALVSIPINEAKVAFDRMFSFSLSPSIITEKNDSIKKINSIEISQLTFSFLGRAPLLEDISLFLSKGQLVTLLGESGSGKSTILNILQKFQSFEKGFITINKELNLERIPSSEWLSEISYVPQNIHIFNGSVVNNIALSTDPDDWQKVINFCQDIGFDQYISLLPQSYSTVVGDGGINLSGGQCQLIAMARALYHKPKVLLLDEATSAMDRQTESNIFKMLQQVKKETIILIVTHQIKIAAMSDYIYLLEDKTISTHGTPNDLMQQKNLYSEAIDDMKTTLLSLS